MTVTPAPAPPSDLMVIVLAYKNGEADWPTTKAALLAFPYVKEPEPPGSVRDPAYGDWYNSDPGILPNSHDELYAAVMRDELERDRFFEILEAQE